MLTIAGGILLTLFFIILGLWVIILIIEFWDWIILIGGTLFFIGLFIVGYILLFG